MGFSTASQLYPYLETRGNFIGPQRGKVMSNTALEVSKSEGCTNIFGYEPRMASLALGDGGGCSLTTLCLTGNRIPLKRKGPLPEPLQGCR